MIFLEKTGGELQSDLSTSDQSLVVEASLLEKQLAPGSVPLTTDSFGPFEVQRTKFGDNRLAVHEHIGFRTYREILNASEFVEQLKERSPGLFESAMKGRPLIDIGAGNDLTGLSAAVRMESSDYIAVEPFYANTLARPMEFIHEMLEADFERATLPQQSIFDADANTFFRGLETPSFPVNLFMRSPQFAGGEYAAELAEHTSRVLDSHGLLILSFVQPAARAVSAFIEDLRARDLTIGKVEYHQGKTPRECLLVGRAVDPAWCE